MAYPWHLAISGQGNQGRMRGRVMSSEGSGQVIQAVVWGWVLGEGRG